MTGAAGAVRPVGVVLVRPWTDARAGGGCCGGEVRDGVAHAPLAPVLDQHACRDDADPVGRAWRRLREERDRVPALDVQVVDAGNPWLLATVFAAVRRRSGLAAALRAAAHAPTAGSVIVDGERVGDLVALGPEGVAAAVRAHLERPRPRPRRPAVTPSYLDWCRVATPHESK